jgi:hypothetical protein
MTLRHSLYDVELVTSLVRHDPGLAQVWLTESHIPELDGVKPDQLVVIDTGEASALILVEVDESTRHRLSSANASTPTPSSSRSIVSAGTCCGSLIVPNVWHRYARSQDR